jgi:two-component system, chemotaxis family, chemotaxis protein CheY
MPRTVLLVDDSVSIREIIKTFMGGGTFVFLEEETGDSALEVARGMQLDLVVADVKMPGMDGLTFVRHLRASKRPHLRAVPVILLTAEKSEELKKEALEAGVNVLVQKPVNRAKFMDVVNQLLGECAAK